MQRSLRFISSTSLFPYFALIPSSRAPKPLGASGQTAKAAQMDKVLKFVSETLPIVRVVGIISLFLFLNACLEARGSGIPDERR
jgi:hypothetical protein